jgi:hypothetical protein
MLVNSDVVFGSDLQHLVVELNLELSDQVLIELDGTLHHFLDFTQHLGLLLAQEVKRVYYTASSLNLSNFRVVLLY